MGDWHEAEAHADRALDWFERGRWADAEAELRKALALNPDRADWHFNLALTLEAAGRDAEALACFDQAIGLMPEQVEPLVAAGTVANRLGRHRLALDRLDAALRLDRTCEPAYAHRMEALLRLEAHDELETTFYLAEHELTEPSAMCLAVLAESLIERRDWDRAEWCLKRALRFEPSLPRLRARLGMVLAATGRPHRALQMYLRDLRDDPGNIDTLLDYGDLLLDLGRLPDAAEKFRRVLEIEPANVDAHHRLGRIAMRGRRWEQAHVEFELVLKLDAGFPEVNLDLAEALLRRSRLRDARLALQRELDAVVAGDERGDGDGDDDGDGAGAGARAASNDDMGRLRRLGDLLLEASWPAAAERVLRRALDGGADDVELHRGLALACFQSGARDRGVIASRRALRRDPSCLRSIHNLALAALEENRLRLAAGWIARGLTVDRHDVGIRRLRMRLALARLGRWVGKK